MYFVKLPMTDVKDIARRGVCPGSVFQYGDTTYAKTSSTFAIKVSPNEPHRPWYDNDHTKSYQALTGWPFNGIQQVEALHPDWKPEPVIEVEEDIEDENPWESLRRMI